MSNRAKLPPKQELFSNSGESRAEGGTVLKKIGLTYETLTEGQSISPELRVEFSN